VRACVRPPNALDAKLGPLDAVAVYVDYTSWRGQAEYNGDVPYGA
jgi:hypothetical protein